MLCTLVDNMMVHRPHALMAPRQRVIVQKRYNSVLEPAAGQRLGWMRSHGRSRRFYTLTKWACISKHLGRFAPFGNPITLSAALLVLWVGGMSLPALAESNEVIIRLEVPDRSEATVDLAAREALEGALLRLSGDRELLEHPAVSAALSSARSNLSLYQFERADGITRFVAHIDQAVLEALIKEANGTVWAEARPPILLWLVIDDPAGRRFGNTAAEQPLWTDLSAAFDRLGVNVRQPLYDLSDSVLVSPETLWRRDFGPILEASERYGMTHLLVGRLIGLSEGRYIGEWLYRDASVERTVSVQSASTQALIDPGLSLAMKEMRRQYAVALTTESSAKKLRVSVRNVVHFEDYRAVTDAIAGIQTLDYARPVAVEGDVLTLELLGIGNAETLLRLMASRTDLVWVNTDPDSAEGLVLAWQGP